jgi:CDP-diacylglycerol--glycerol-3-phosphate 3-phosphatidyltransferase
MFQVKEITYPSNLLSIARLALLPPTLRFLEHPGKQWHALGCLGVAMLTDALDGSLARQRGEVSYLGKILDPIADKLVIDMVAVKLSQTHHFPRWMTRLLLLRDAFIVLLGGYLYRRRAHIAVSQSAGKATTVAMTMTLLLYIADGPRSGKPALYAALVPFALSFGQYGRAFLRALHNQ